METIHFFLFYEFYYQCMVSLHEKSTSSKHFGVAKQRYTVL